jgi:predicted kinase
MVKIMQAVSGGGKDTFIKKFLQGYRIYSSDNFFTDEDGVYHFDINKLGEAHAQCLRQFSAAVQGGNDMKLVVNNTNTTVLEVGKYAELAIAWGHAVEVITLDIPWEIAAARNVHGTPREIVQGMAARIKDSHKQFPRWWRHTIIDNRPVEAAKEVA